MFNKYQIGEYLYTRLPSYHQIVDEEQNNRVLKKFFEVLNESFKINMEDLDKALALTQASRCPEESLEELAKSLGADWISTIHPKYQRQIISMLIKLYQQKGTVDTIRFIASELSGFEAKIIEGDIPDEYFKPGDEKKRLLTVKLQAPELDDPVTSQQHESTISEVISKFVPVHTKFVLLVTYFYNEDYFKQIIYNTTNKFTQKVDVEVTSNREMLDTKHKVKIAPIQEDAELSPLIENILDLKIKEPKDEANTLQPKEVDTSKIHHLISEENKSSIEFGTESVTIEVTDKESNSLHYIGYNHKLFALSNTRSTLNSVTSILTTITVADKITTSEGVKFMFE